MGRWLHLLLFVPVLCLIHTADSVIATEASCIYLRLFNADLLPLRGLLLQKQEQTNVWVQAVLNDDDDTLSTNQLSSELFSLGTQPVVMVTTDTATYQIPVEWKPDMSMWMFSLLKYTFYDLGYTVQVQLSPQQANRRCAEISTERFTVLTTSQVPVVQWFLEHGSTYEQNLNGEEPFVLAHLHCYPEVMLAVQDINKHDAGLTPVVYQTTIKSAKKLQRGDHVMIDSQHYLVDSVAEMSFSAYTLNDDGQVEWCDDLTFIRKGSIITCPEHSDYIESKDALGKATQVLKRRRRWNGSDLFVTAMKCGREHPVPNDCILDHRVKITGYTSVSPDTKIREGDHLVFYDKKNSPNSVLVTKCFDHTQVAVKPSFEGNDILDITCYPEVFLINYSHSLPAKRVLLRACSQRGLHLLTLDDHSHFASWAKTGKEMSLPSNFLKQVFSFEKIASQIEVKEGDHIVKQINSSLRHYIVSHCDDHKPRCSVIYCQAGGFVREDSISYDNSDLYRVVYRRDHVPSQEAVRRAKSQVGQKKHNIWDHMLFIIQAKTHYEEGKMLVTNIKKVILTEQKVCKGDHLILCDGKHSLHSVVVMQWINQESVQVQPPVKKCEIAILSNYSEIYKVELGNTSSTYQAEGGKFVMSLSDFIKTCLGLESVGSVNEIQVGDHLLELVETQINHMIIKRHLKRSVFIILMPGSFEEKALDLSSRELYRLVCLQKFQSEQTTIMRSKLCIGNDTQIAWDDFLVDMTTKSFMKPLSKTLITSFSQLHLGDYVVAESRMAQSHHYIVAFIALPNVCTAIECHNGKVSQVNLTTPEKGKYPKYYRLNYHPGVCIPAKESVDMALSLVSKKFTNRNFIHFLKTNEEGESSTEPVSQTDSNSSGSRNEISIFSELKLGDYLVKERLAFSRHYIVTSVSSSGSCEAVECCQGIISKAVIPFSGQDKHTKYYRLNYGPQACICANKSMKMALLLVDRSFVHLLKTNEVDIDVCPKSPELTAAIQHNFATPQYIKAVHDVSEIGDADHIIYSVTKPPLLPDYRSALVLDAHSDNPGLIDCVTLDKVGLINLKAFKLKLLTNLGKVVYQGCTSTATDVVIRGSKALQFKDAETYHEECNNSHHFVTRIVAEKESSLSQLLKVYIQSLTKHKTVSPLKPVLKKVSVSKNEKVICNISPGNHILIGSEHCLVKYVNVEENTFEAYKLDSKKNIVRASLKISKEDLYKIDYDSKSQLIEAEDTLKLAEYEMQRKADWERSDLFVTTVKCGSGFIVDDRCIFPENIDIHCTEISEHTAVDNGDHLLVRDEKTGRLCSVLVFKFYHQTRIEVLPPLSKCTYEHVVIDLTQYKEKLRVNYSHSLPSVEVNTRVQSQIGRDILKQCSNDCSPYIYWAKTGREMEESPDSLVQSAKRLAVVCPKSYDKVYSPYEIKKGDHLFWDSDKLKTHREHVMVTECIPAGDSKGRPTMFKVIYLSGGCFKETVKCFAINMGEDTYRVNYSEAIPAKLAIKRARSKLREHHLNPLGRMWFVPWAKTGSTKGIEVGFLKNNARPVSKSRILCFSQLNPGDYLVEEPRMNFYHHYIVLSITAPNQCIVVESWQKVVRRVNLTWKHLSDPNQRPWYYRVNYERGACVRPEESIDKAKDLINTRHLHPMSKCLRETFIHFLKTGEAADIDTDDLLDDRLLLQRERVTSATELKCGDHIERPLALAPHHAQHHMLVVEAVDDEHCKVIHYHVDKSIAKVLKFKKGDIKCEVVNIFDQDQVSRIRYTERIDPTIGMRTLVELCAGKGKSALKYLTGVEEYNIKENNCEHLVTLATIGVPLSIQVDQAVLQALQCSKAAVKSAKLCVVSHTYRCGPGNIPLHDFGAAQYVTHISSTTHLGHTIASKTGNIAVEVGSTSSAKATVKTSSKAAFEAGSEAAISGTVLGAIGGIAFGVNVLLETPFYIRGAYKLHRQKKFGMISKVGYEKEMIKMSVKSANTVIGGTLGAVAGQAAIPVPVVGAVVGGFVGSLAGQVCGHLEGKAISHLYGKLRDPGHITLPILLTQRYVKVDDLLTKVGTEEERIENSEDRDINDQNGNT